MSTVFQAQFVKICPQVKKNHTLVFASVTHAGADLDTLAELAETPMVMFRLPGLKALDELKASYGELSDGLAVKTGDVGYFLADGIFAWNGNFVLNGTDTPVHHLKGFVDDAFSLAITKPQPKMQTITLIFRNTHAVTDAAQTVAEAPERAWA